MKPNNPLYCLLAIIATCFIQATAFADTTYVKFGSTWKYLDNGTAAPTGSGAADWRNVSFNDAAWNSGPAELGYGDFKERTAVSYGGNPSSKYITTYFRKTLNIADISLYSGIRLNTYIDDGAVIYVNGTEVARTNMPAGTPTNATLASAAAAENGNTIITFDIPTTSFVSGNNLIAVEVHQNSASSSDLTFDLELIAKPAGGTIFNFGSTWKYLDNGSNQGTAWIPAAFSDASWKTGTGKFGYGDVENTYVFSGCGTSNYPAAEPTAPSCGTKYITTYFRKTFNITGVSNYSSFTINAYRDDGMAVYVNGVEVVRDLLAAGATYTTTATNAADDGQTINSYSVPASYFAEGSNTIAVELHQTSASSSDLTFDMQLVGNTGAAEPDIIRGPLLQMLNGTAVSIRWTTASATTSRLKYGSSENSLTSTLSDNTSVTEHELRITGLTADTKYFYAVGSANSIVKGSYRNYFTTAPPANTTRKIRIGVFGDPGTGNSVQKSTRDAYLDLRNGYNNSELAIMLGDNAYNAGLQTEHQSNFFNIYNDNIFPSHVVLPVPGNHEYANDASTPLSSNLRYTRNIPYYSIFTLPTAGESGGVASGTEQYYSADYGNIHFIMLDSYGYTPDPTDPTNIAKYTRLFDDTTNGPQAKWLKQDLAANAGTHKWTIVCMHHPPYTNGTHVSGYSSDGESDLVALRKYIAPIFERFGVDIVLTGHSHVYERTFLIKGHTSFATSFTAANKMSTSSGRYDGTAGNVASSDFNAATTSCPYFTIDSTYNHGTVYIVAGSAGQIGGGTNAMFPAFYYKNYSGSTNGEAGSMYLEIQDNRLDAKFAGSGGTHDQFTIMKGVNKKTVVNTTVNTPTTLTASWIGGYNWYTAPFPPIVTQGTNRTFSVTPSASGTYTYYVNDSISPKATCIADTFQLQVISTLAVSVINYNALLKNKNVFVNWTTTQEINNDYFTIERSANGRDYEMVIIMPGKGNSASATNYEFIDRDPLPGVSYYRLSATDKDGDTKIAGIKTVNNSSVKDFSISIQPNPAVNNEVNTVLQSAKKQLVKIKVYNTGGAEVYSKQWQVQPGSNPLRFNLPAGIYIINTEAQDGSRMTEKLIVK